MNTNTLNYIPGHALGHDDRYERVDAAEAADARDAARAADATEERLFELESERWSEAQPTMDAAMERLADQQDFNRWLFALWQARVKWPGPEETASQKAVRAFAAQQITNLLTSALASAVEDGQ